MRGSAPPSGACLVDTLNTVADRAYRAPHATVRADIHRRDRRARAGRGQRAGAHAQRPVAAGVRVAGLVRRRRPTEGGQLSQGARGIGAARSGHAARGAAGTAAGPPRIRLPRLVARLKAMAKIGATPAGGSSRLALTRDDYL